MFPRQIIKFLPPTNAGLNNLFIYLIFFLSRIRIVIVFLFTFLSYRLFLFHIFNILGFRYYYIDFSCLRFRFALIFSSSCEFPLFYSFFSLIFADSFFFYFLFFVIIFFYRFCFFVVTVSNATYLSFSRIPSFYTWCGVLYYVCDYSKADDIFLWNLVWSI